MSETETKTTEDRSALTARKASAVLDWLEEQYEESKTTIRGNYTFFAGVNTDIFLSGENGTTSGVEEMDIFVATDTELARWWSSACDLAGMEGIGIGDALMRTRPKSMGG